MSKKIIIVIAIFAVAGIFLPVSKPVITLDEFGGLVHHIQESFDSGIAVNSVEVLNSNGMYVGALGGTKTTLTGATSTTITAAALCAGGLIEYAPTSASASTTFDTAANMIAKSGCLSRDGATRIVMLRNTGATATTTSFLIAGTGIIMTEPDGQNVLIEGGNEALITIVRASSTAVIINVDELIDAD